MKRKRLFLPLVSKLSKIYFSNHPNKNNEYKRTIFYSLKEMGGVYIKFLQVLCVTQNFTDGWAGPKEFDVFNKVELEPFDIKLYLPNKEKFSHIETTPFASGSFAQIYKGTLKTGDRVVIKALRPGIANSLQTDLNKIKRLVKIISKFLPAMLLDYMEAYDEFSRNCLLETDYDREIANMEYFHRMYEDHNYVVIPKVYRENSNKRIIVQEYIDGVALADIITEAKPGTSLEKYAYSKTGSNIWTQIMIAGGELVRTSACEDYTYGDPHPGNIMLLRDDKIAFIDFGIIANRPTSQEAFYLWSKAYYDMIQGGNDVGRLVETTCTCFCPDLVNAFKKCSISINSNRDFIDSLANALNMKAQTIRGNNEHADNMIKNGHIFRMFTKFIDSKNAIKLKLDMNNFQLLKAMQAFIASVTMIDNKYCNSKMFQQLMSGALEYALEYCEEYGVKHDLDDNTKYTVNESYEILLDTFTSLAEGDEFLFQNVSERMFL